MVDGGMKGGRMVQILIGLRGAVRKVLIRSSLGTRIMYLLKKRFLNPRTIRECNKWLRRILKGRCFDTVLDLGCGMDSDHEGGRYSEYYSCKRMIRVDARPTVPNLDYVAKAENLPLPDESVDFVFMHWVFYLTDMPRAISEVRRVLKRGGHAMVSYVSTSPDRVAAIRAIITQVFEIEELFRSVLDERFWGGPLRRAEAMFGVVKSQRGAPGSSPSMGRAPVDGMTNHGADEDS
jgi:SAM-dependent methyltransferase